MSCVPVATPPAAEYVALGAARQAAWALSGDPLPPEWTLGAPAEEASHSPEAGNGLRERYAEYRRALHGV
ncbi:hypothetical protein [Nocardiopsis alba]|uniref:hypothetical protein n=1 Tax=Nocardiopsis alba TaxID=53437 RepID=UPI003F4D6084